MSEHPREQLRRNYQALVAVFTRQFPNEQPAPFPRDDAPLNTMVNVNQLLVARINGREPIVITEKKEPLVVRDRDAQGKKDDA